MKQKLDILFKSEVHMKIIRFFHENPASIDTPRGVAAWTGYRRNAVKKALNELAAKGVLVAHSVPSTTGFSYTQDRKMIKALDKKIKQLKRKEAIS